MRKKAVITIIWMSLLAGCGGGGNSGSTSTDISTPMRTPVNVAAIKAIYNGTATSSTQASFSLTGSDMQGNSWTGSYTLVSDDATTLNGQNVTSSHSVLTFQKLGEAGSSLSTTRYFLAPLNFIYKIIEDSGRVISSISGTSLPDVALIGDSSTGAASVNDGTRAFIGWMLDPDVNGNSKLTFSSGTLAPDNSLVPLENDSFYLDPFGSIYKMTVVIKTGGTTVTLSGNKN